MSKKQTSGGVEPQKQPNRYDEILARIFASHHSPGLREFVFERNEIEAVAAQLQVRLPKNLGDLIYSFRFRSSLPDEVVRTAPPDYEWVILLAGRGRYRMKLVRISRILPSPNKYQIKIPDATPQLVASHALGDEQSLLAKVRYNRLIDVFLRVAAYSLQSHLRTTVPEMGQIETDEVYVAVRNSGQQFVVPVQAKGGADQLSVVQVQQDLALCRHAFPRLTTRPVAVQFVRDGGGELIVMFELVQDGDEIKVLDEKHYRLVPSDAITPVDLDTMSRSSD